MSRSPTGGSFASEGEARNLGVANANTTAKSLVGMAILVNVMKAVKCNLRARFPVIQISIYHLRPSELRKLTLDPQGAKMKVSRKCG